jgi:hypothetical protein
MLHKANFESRSTHSLIHSYLANQELASWHGNISINNVNEQECLSNLADKAFSCICQQLNYLINPG